MSVSDMELKECHSLIYPDYSLVDFVTSYKEVSEHSQIKDELISTSLLKILINCPSWESLTVSMACVLSMKPHSADVAITHLEDTKLILVQSLEIMKNIISGLTNIQGDKGSIIKTKITQLHQKNKGFQVMEQIGLIISGSYLCNQTFFPEASEKSTLSTVDETKFNSSCIHF
ncbi:hypothetical protein QTP88_023284 [Uroleucon formosanum]